MKIIYEMFLTRVFQKCGWGLEDWFLALRRAGKCYRCYKRGVQCPPFRRLLSRYSISRGMDTLEGPQEGRRAGIAHGQPREATLLVNADVCMVCNSGVCREQINRCSNVKLLEHYKEKKSEKKLRSLSLCRAGIRKLLTVNWPTM